MIKKLSELAKEEGVVLDYQIGPDDGSVRYIRRSNKSNYRLAKELSVDPSTIRDARNKKTWRHII